MLLLLKSNCDQLDRIGGLQSKRGHMQEPDTKLTWMNHWNDVGVEGDWEDKTGSAISMNIGVPTFST